MEKTKIERINEFARRVKAGETLSADELKERDELRREYIDSVKANLTGHLDNVYFKNDDGSLTKLRKKGENDE